MKKKRKGKKFWISITPVISQDAKKPKTFNKLVGYDVYKATVDPNWRRHYTVPVAKSWKQLNKRRFKTKAAAEKFVKRMRKKGKSL